MTLWSGIEITLLVIFAFIFAFIGDALNLPLSWLLIPIIISVVWSMGKKNNSSIPKPFSMIGQGIMAISSASRFSPDIFFQQSHHYFFPLVVCIIVTSGLSLCNSYLIYKLADIDFRTSVLGCIPGAGHSLVAMSEEIGADAITVAILQYLRILMVSLIVPSIVSFFSLSSTSLLNSPIHHHNYPSLPPFINLLILALVGILGVKIGEILKIPSNLFLGVFLSSLLLFSFFPYELTIPPSIFRGGLLLLGLSIGVKFQVESLQKLVKAIFLEIILVLFLIVTCLLLGYWVHLTTNLDTLTAILGSTPGGLSAMMATVIELGGNSGVVLTMQMSRMLLILFLTPILTNYFLTRKKEKV